MPPENPRSCRPSRSRGPSPRPPARPPKPAPHLCAPSAPFPSKGRPCRALPQGFFESRRGLIRCTTPGAKRKAAGLETSERVIACRTKRARNSDCEERRKRFGCRDGWQATAGAPAGGLPLQAGGATGPYGAHRPNATQARRLRCRGPAGARSRRPSTSISTGALPRGLSLKGATLGEPGCRPLNRTNRLDVIYYLRPGQLTLMRPVRPCYPAARRLCASPSCASSSSRLLHPPPRSPHSPVMPLSPSSSQSHSLFHFPQAVHAAVDGQGEVLEQLLQLEDVAAQFVAARRDARCSDRLSIWTWTHWGLNPGPSACEADVIPLHHVPLT